MEEHAPADPACEPAEPARPAERTGPADPVHPSDRADPGTAAGPARPGQQVRLTAWVRGRVQGVGFRWWTRCRARELGLTGHATNLDDGRVQVVAEGPRTACERLLAALRGPGTPGNVAGVTHLWGDPRGGMTGFVER